MAFIDKIKHEHIPTCSQASDIPALRRLETRPTVEEILAAVSDELSESEKEVRQIGVYLCHTLSGLPLRQLGEIFGLRETALCEASRRMGKKIAANPSLAEAVYRIRGRVKS